MSTGSDDVLVRFGRWALAKVWFGVVVSGGWAIGQHYEWSRVFLTVAAVLGAVALALASSFLPVWTRQRPSGIPVADVGLRVMVWGGLVIAVIALLIGMPAIGMVAAALLLNTAARTFGDPFAPFLRRLRVTPSVRHARRVPPVRHPASARRPRPPSSPTHPPSTATRPPSPPRPSSAAGRSPVPPRSSSSAAGSSPGPAPTGSSSTAGRPSSSASRAPASARSSSAASGEPVSPRPASAATGPRVPARSFSAADTASEVPPRPAPGGARTSAPGGSVQEKQATVSRRPEM